MNWCLTNSSWEHREAEKRRRRGRGQCEDGAFKSTNVKLAFQLHTQKHIETMVVLHSLLDCFIFSRGGDACVCVPSYLMRCLVEELFM